MSAVKARRLPRPNRVRAPLLALVAGISCGHLTDPPLPANAQLFVPPPVYAGWWTMVESCSGLSGSLENIQWYSTTSLLRDPNDDDDAIAGYWSLASSLIDGGLATFTISVHNPFSHPVVVSLPSMSGSVPVSYGYAMRESSGAGVSSGGLALDIGVTYFAAGETKRDVIDFFVIAPDFPSYQGGPGLGESPIALPVGTYSFQGDYGGNAAPNLTVVLSQ